MRLTSEYKNYLGAGPIPGGTFWEPAFILYLFGGINVPIENNDY